VKKHVFTPKNHIFSPKPHAYNAKELKSLANSNKNVKTPHAMQHD
jgi:hypothetical protein